MQHVITIDAITDFVVASAIKLVYVFFLFSAPPQECCFMATWKDGIMQVSVPLYTLDGSAFESQKIKICLLPDSGPQGKENKGKILASCRLDLSNLRLQCNGDEGKA